MRTIILKIIPYKEANAIITGLTENGFVDFQVRGLLKSKSSFSYLNNPLCVADLIFLEGNFKYPILKTSNLVELPNKNDTDLFKYAAILFLAETTKTMLQDNEASLLYKHLILSIKNINQNINTWAILFNYVGKIFSSTGLSLSYDKCAICGSNKNINGFSFKNGGAICSKCNHDDYYPLLNETDINVMRHLFEGSITSDISDETGHKIMQILYEFIKDNYGVSLKSVELIQKL